MNEANHKSKHMQILFQYIENNMSTDLDTVLLSKIGYVSRNKLYYDFYSQSGHSVKEYIRKRRLSNALALIKASTFSLTDIAHQCGYSSHQALCKAVRQTLGLTPSEYRQGSTYYFFPPFHGEPLRPVTVSNEIFPLTLRVLFFYPRLKNIENMAVSTFLSAFPNYSGRIFGRNAKHEGGKFCYELNLTETNINHSLLSSYGFEIALESPCHAVTFATVCVINDEHKINAAWDYLYSEWLHNSMFEYTGDPYYEEFILKNKEPIKLRLYLPIRERSEDTRITLINNPGLRFITAKARGYNAEEIASGKVMDYFKAHYPYLISTSNELYFRKEAEISICGIRVNPELQTVTDENVADITIGSDSYLVLESSVIGDYNRYAEFLLSFSRDNGIDADGDGIFAVYDARESLGNLKIKMYCPVKIRTKR